MDVIDFSLLALFVPTFFFVSVTPGLCMTLALTMGMTLGVRRTLWMMAGELTGVALVAVTAVLGIAALMLKYPGAFQVFKYCGGAYLAWLGLQMWRARGHMAIVTSKEGAAAPPTRGALAAQGFITAVANPKGWAFFIALLPPFISDSRPLAPQLAVLVAIILLLESLCLLIYAGGGRTLSRLLARGDNLRLINRIAGSLMMGVGIWLAFG
ncbi:LysE family translocator [Microbulbifer thermotolerans]|uniref:LysE family translocator n=1 Tax=Microbulbifer thermotolerans TaxID=252514 RepID=UPI002248D961|nr:LysE family translocator [Microbulbifer thermotolerans]MCX2793663.1 LysE family translocator [Microbulbifer thermotolerans]WKT61821.1 LysE family translocator [Microbulbifer thermotolerans]